MESHASFRSAPSAVRLPVTASILIGIACERHVEETGLRRICSQNGAYHLVMPCYHALLF